MGSVASPSCHKTNHHACLSRNRNHNGLMKPETKNCSGSTSTQKLMWFSHSLPISYSQMAHSFCTFNSDFWERKHIDLGHFFCLFVWSQAMLRTDWLSWSHVVSPWPNRSLSLCKCQQGFCLRGGRKAVGQGASALWECGAQQDPWWHTHTTPFHLLGTNPVYPNHTHHCTLLTSPSKETTKGACAIGSVCRGHMGQVTTMVFLSIKSTIPWWDSLILYSLCNLSGGYS